MTSKNILLSVIFSGAFFTASAIGMEGEVQKKYFVSSEIDDNSKKSYIEATCEIENCEKFCDWLKYYVCKNIDGSFSQYGIFLNSNGGLQTIKCPEGEKEILKKKIEDFEEAEREKEEKEKTGKKLDFESEKK